MPLNTVKDLKDREAVIEQAKSTGRTERVPFRGEYKDLEVKRVPDDVLVYRLENIRTLVKQREKVSQLKLEPDFFVNSAEGQQAQEHQHSILVEMSKDSRANIHAALESEARQTQPLVITTSGTVVNGNRRLAAMRDLTRSDKKSFQSFFDVDVAVLPLGTNETDLIEIETRLQIVPDLKSEYGWVEKCLALRTQHDEHERTMRYLAALWGEDEKSLQENLRHLVLAEHYLESIGEPKRYELVADHQQVIQTYAKEEASFLKDGWPQEKIEAARGLMWVAVGHDVEGRKYDYAREIRSLLEKVQAKHGKEASTPESRKKPDPKDPIGGLPVHPLVDPELVKQIKDPDEGENLAKELEDALEDVRSEKRQKKRGNQLDAGVTAALRKLSSLNLRDVDPGTYEASLAGLIAIGADAARLINLLVAEDASLANDLADELQESLKAAADGFTELHSRAS